MTPHIEAKKEDIAKTVIMPGDPKRAKLIATKYLKDPRLVSEVRGILAYTGFYKDKQVTIMASGMGMPSIDNIIRIGTCGALQKDVCLNDIIIPNNALTLSNFSYQYDGINQNEEQPSKYLYESLTKSAKKLDFNILSGTINTSDIFYGETQNPLKSALVVEMETFALFYIAKKLNKNAGAVLTVTDHLIKNQRLSSLERENNLDKAITIVLESL